jgi:hypothetical protein
VGGCETEYAKRGEGNEAPMGEHVREVREGLASTEAIAAASATMTD